MSSGFKSLYKFLWLSFATIFCSMHAFGQADVGDINIFGLEGRTFTRDCNCWVYNTGAIFITVNDVTISQDYAEGDTSGTVLAGLVNQINSEPAMPVTATTGGGLYAKDPNATASQFTVSTSAIFNDNYFTGSSFQAVIMQHPTFVTGYINPKYLVVGVTYAPPGSGSSVTYTQSDSLSSTTSVAQTFSTSTTTSISIAKGFNLFGYLQGKITTTKSSTSGQSNSSSNSVTSSQSTAIANQSAGFPNNPIVYPPHDYDLIWIWLNPVAIFIVDPSNSSKVIWGGYGFDMNDQPTLDIYPIAVGYLNGDFGSMNASQVAELSRSWASTSQTFPSGQGPALTQADYNQILLADPFASSSYVFSPVLSQSPVTTSDGRYSLASGVSGATNAFDVVQGNPGQASGPSQTYTNSYTDSSTAASGVMFTNSSTYGIDVSFSGSSFLSTISGDIAQQNTFATTYSRNNSISTSSTSTDSLTIVGPACGATTSPCVPQYSGPATYDVYQDNIWGSYAFIAP